MARFGMTVLSVGIRNKSNALRILPVRVLVMDSGAEAIRHLFEDKIDAVISRWNLTDMPSGELLKKIIAARPNLPTIAFVKAGDHQQENLARSTGVSVVLADDIDDEYFRRILRQILNLADVSLIEDISNVSQEELCCYQNKLTNFFSLTPLKLGLTAGDQVARPGGEQTQRSQLR